MKIEMICTGEEVLSGQIVDTNAAWFANRLMDAGFEMNRRTTVGDRIEDLVDLFTERSYYADIILVNGGLGPTADDLSALAMAKAMDVALEENSQWKNTLENWFSKRNIVLTESNLKQALLPEKAIMVENPVGTACGFRVKFNRAWLFFTPGVPHEFKQMVISEFMPFLQTQFPKISQVSVNKLLTLGMGESQMADILENLNWPQGVTLGYRSFSPYLELKLIARETSAKEEQIALEQATKVLGDCIVACNYQSLAEQVHNLLINSGKKIAIAESLTGGDISSQLVHFAGSSSYLKWGVVSYCNEAKKAILNVTDKVISHKTEVSLECVAQMAIGVADLLSDQSNNLLAEKERTTIDFAIATSGIAGPSGGSEEIPMGTVVLAVKANDKTYAQKVLFPSSRTRNYIRDMSAAIALDMLRRAVLGYNPIADYPSIKRLEFEVEDIV